MSNVVQVLVQLLDKIPDADKLQRLLEPENLLFLMTHHGYSRAEMRQQLENGTLPGELLLKLLEREPDVDADSLLAEISNQMDTRLEKRVDISTLSMAPRIPSPREDVVPGTEKRIPVVSSPINLPLLSSAAVSGGGRPVTGSPFGIAALVIMTLTSIVPALMRSGFFPNAMPSAEGTAVVATVGGALAGAIFFFTNRLSLWKGVLIGIVFNLGVLWATAIYMQARTSFFKIEIFIPMLIGSLPAVGLYYVLTRKS